MIRNRDRVETTTTTFANEFLSVGGPFCIANAILSRPLIVTWRMHLKVSAMKVRSAIYHLVASSHTALTSSPRNALARTDCEEWSIKADAVVTANSTVNDKA